MACSAFVACICLCGFTFVVCLALVACLALMACLALVACLAFVACPAFVAGGPWWPRFAFHPVFILGAFVAPPRFFSPCEFFRVPWWPHLVSKAVPVS